MLLVAVPGHHVFKHFQSFSKAVPFRFIPKHWSAESRFANETCPTGPVWSALDSAQQGGIVKAAIYARFSTTDQNCEMRWRNCGSMCYAEAGSWQVSTLIPAGAVPRQAGQSLTG